MILLALVLAVTAPDPPPEMGKEDVAFLRDFVPLAVNALAALAAGDKASVQKLVAYGRSRGFDKHLQRKVGLVQICVPGFKPMCMAELWLRLRETVEPSLDFA